MTTLRRVASARLFRYAGAILTALLTTATLAVPARAAQPTVVSLTFDDGNADQMSALPILNRYGMKGTFYIISGSVGAPNYVTRANLEQLASSGQEIGGHSVTHADLTTVPPEEARRQVCNSRATLSSWGYPQTSFAYPYAAFDAQTEAIVAECGYNSARTLGDLRSRFGCPDCPYAGPIPPADPYNLPALDMVDAQWKLSDLQAAVTNAERAGVGWVPLTFHHVCDRCDSLAVSPSVLNSFLSWLSLRTIRGTTVKTVHQVIGGPVKPVVTVPQPPTPGLTNASLEASTTGSGFPDCWMPGGWGTNTPRWRRVGGAHSGNWAQELTITGYLDGDAKLLPTFDTGTCTPTITPGSSYTIGAWYKATGRTQFALYYRTAAGSWQYWTSSPWLANAADWTQATFVTPPAPPDAVAISFGVSLIANGTLITDDYQFGPA